MVHGKQSAATQVTVRVPASTSNLGSGFDTLGLAVNLYLRCTVAWEADAPAGTIILDPSCSDLTSAEPLIREAAAPWLQGSPAMRVHVQSDVPIGRGLGASAALRAGIVAGCSALRGVELSRQELLDRVYALEKHPDNASPALFGGFTVSGVIDGAVQCTRFDVDPNLKIVTLIPEFELPTGEARKLLPEQYSKAETVHSLNRAAMITAAFATGNYAALRGLFDDVLHQPYRQKLVPQLTATIRAGELAGAIGGFLSGAGSGIICLALDHESEIAAAMKRLMPNSVVHLLRPENAGLSRE